MAMAFFVITTILAFNMITVPLHAFEFAIPDQPGSNPFYFFPFGGLDDGNDEPQPFDQPQPIDPPKAKQKDHENKKLQEGFYSETCPNAEQIVADEVAKIVESNPGAIAALIRLQFHDCFVGGCDASILLDSMSYEDVVEKASMSNGEFLKGADLIDDIKVKLEQECPGIVSCADTLAFATVEAMVLGGLPRKAKLGGRRDGLISLSSNTDGNLPLPNWSMDQMLELFKTKGFSTEDLVVLLGAHSVGSAHCAIFSDRLYNYGKSGNPDPSLSSNIIGELKKICKPPGTPEARNNPLVNFDETPTVLDNLFFKNLMEKRKALLVTDQELIIDNRTAPVVEKMARNPRLFPNKFAKAMIRLSSLGVITGNEGEVRRTCRSTN